MAQPQAEETYDGTFNVRDYGAVGDGDTDDGPAIQAAINAAHNGQNVTSGRVLFPPGAYGTTQELEWKNCHLVGMFPNNSTRIIWNGPEGGTCLTKTDNSFGELSGINFRTGFSGGYQVFGKGDIIPGRWVHLTEKLVDKNLNIRNVHFMACSIAAIETVRWVNFHLRDIRWDQNSSGYAIKLVNTGQMNLASFVLDSFTYDHQGTAPGFIRVENANNSSNLGTFHVSNGRMEINTPWVDEQAILSYGAVDRTPDKGPKPRAVGWHLSDMTLDITGNGAMENAVVLYRDTNDTMSSESLMLTNFRSQGLQEVLGGTWPAGWTNYPNGDHYMRLVVTRDYMIEEPLLGEAVTS